MGFRSMLIEQNLERRRKPRIRVTFPMKIRGYYETGEKFEGPGILENISATGLYFHTDTLLKPGDKIFATIQLTKSEVESGVDENYLTTIGNVVRVDFPATHTYGVAVQINNYRFM